MTIRILGPARNLIPSRWFVGHGDAALLGDFSEFKAHVADVGRCIFALSHKLRNLFGRSHVRILRLNLVLRLKIVPRLHPIGPGIRHAYRINGTFLLRSLQKGFNFGSRGLGNRCSESTGGNKGCGKRFLH